MEILGTSTVSSAVESLIDRAQKALFIVTPYFKPWDRVGRAIKGVRARDTQVLVLLRGGEDRAKSEERVREFLTHGVRVAYLSRLHAKIYASESEVIVTSMNLYDSSALDSFEVAVRFTREADGDAYRQVVQQVIDLAKKADEEAKVNARERAVIASPLTAVHARVTGKPVPLPSKGHCIRCDKPVAFNPEKPLCADCYKSWAKYANPDYEEARCHRCGKDAKTSAAKPLCRPCWSATA